MGLELGALSPTVHSLIPDFMLRLKSTPLFIGPIWLIHTYIQPHSMECLHEFKLTLILSHSPKHISSKISIEIKTNEKMTINNGELNIKNAALPRKIDRPN